MKNLAQAMRLFLGGVAAATVAACASAPPPKPKTLAPPKPKVLTPAELFEKGTKAFTDGDYATAVTQYDKVLAKEPKNTTALYNKALALHRTGNFKGAQAAYQAVLAIDPHDIEAALNLGAVKKEIGDNQGAIAVYRRILEKDEFNTRVLNNLAALYRAEGKHDKAIGAIRKLLMRDKNNVDAYKNLALVYFDQEKYKLTQTILDNALRMAKEQNRTEPDIYVNLGRMYLATEENGKAMAAFKKAVQLKPDHTVANYNIGALALGHRDYLMAAKAYDVCAKAWPEKYDVWASLGYAYQGMQEFAKAEEHLAKARKLLINQSAAVAQGPLKQKLAEEDEQMLLQLVRTAQGAEQNQKALGYAQEYLQMKGITCKEDDYDGFCGRVNGIKLTIQMEKEAMQAPPPEEPGQKGMNVDDATVLTEGEEAQEAAEAAAGVQGGEAPSDGELPPK